MESADKEFGILNKVSNSGLISLDLEKFRPDRPLFYDLKQNLYLEQVLREKEFREFLKIHDWEQYCGRSVAIGCSVDAIIPLWAYMLLAGSLQPYASKIFKGTEQSLEILLWEEALLKIDKEIYRNQRVIVKGCGELPVPEMAYLTITLMLKPIVKSLMFGEACSTVPLFKN